MSYEQRADRLNQLFLEKIVPFVRDVNERAMNSASDGQLEEQGSKQGEIQSTLDEQIDN